MNTKLLKQLTLATALMAAVGAAAANDTADIKVIGRITPGACELSLGNGGTFDYDQMDISTLSAVAKNSLGAKDTDVSITCSGPVQAGLRAIDNQAASVPAGTGWGGSAAGTGQFGLGTASDGTMIGAYVMTLAAKSVQLDGAAASKGLRSQDNGKTWINDVYSESFNSGNKRILSWSNAAAPGVPAAFTTMTGTLGVSTVIQPTDNLPVGRAVDLNGQATLEVVYL